MALGVLNNLSAIYAENNLNNTNNSLQTVLQQLSSGSKINSGADDAAGLSLVNGLAANAAALTQSETNSTEGVGLLQVADGALSQVTSLLNRAITLATEASNGTLNSTQAAAANQEYQTILSEINNIGSTTTFNQVQVFNDENVAIYTGDSSTTGSSIDDLYLRTLSEASVGDSGGAMSYSTGQDNVFLNLSTASTNAKTSDTLNASGQTTIDVDYLVNGANGQKTTASTQVSVGTGTSYANTVSGLISAFNNAGLGLTAAFATQAQAGVTGGGEETGIEITGGLVSAGFAPSSVSTSGTLNPSGIPASELLTQGQTVAVTQNGNTLGSVQISPTINTLQELMGAINNASWNGGDSTPSKFVAATVVTNGDGTQSLSLTDASASNGTLGVRVDGPVGSAQAPSFAAPSTASLVTVQTQGTSAAGSPSVQVKPSSVTVGTGSNSEAATDVLTLGTQIMIANSMPSDHQSFTFVVGQGTNISGSNASTIYTGGGEDADAGGAQDTLQGLADAVNAETGALGVYATVGASGLTFTTGTWNSGTGTGTPIGLGGENISVSLASNPLTSSPTGASGTQLGLYQPTIAGVTSLPGAPAKTVLDDGQAGAAAGDALTGSITLTNSYGSYTFVASNGVNSGNTIYLGNYLDSGVIDYNSLVSAITATGSTDLGYTAAWVANGSSAAHGAVVLTAAANGNNPITVGSNTLADGIDSVTADSNGATGTDNTLATNSTAILQLGSSSITDATAQLGGAISLSFNGHTQVFIIGSAPTNGTAVPGAIYTGSYAGANDVARLVAAINSAGTLALQAIAPGTGSGGIYLQGTVGVSSQITMNPIAEGTETALAVVNSLTAGAVQGGVTGAAGNAAVDNITAENSSNQATAVNTDDTMSGQVTIVNTGTAASVVDDTSSPLAAAGTANTPTVAVIDTGAANLITNQLNGQITVTVGGRTLTYNAQAGDTWQTLMNAINTGTIAGSGANPTGVTAQWNINAGGTGVGGLVLTDYSKGVGNAVTVGGTGLTSSVADTFIVGEGANSGNTYYTENTASSGSYNNGMTLAGLASTINEAASSLQVSAQATSAGLTLTQTGTVQNNNTTYAGGSISFGADTLTDTTESLLSSVTLGQFASESDTVNGTMSFTINGSTQTVTMSQVETAEGGTTVEDLVNYINANSTQGANLGVSAAWAATTNGFGNVVLTSTTEGAQGNITSPLEAMTDTTPTANLTYSATNSYDTGLTSASVSSNNEVYDSSSGQSGTAAGEATFVSDARSGSGIAIISYSDGSGEALNGTDLLATGDSEIALNDLNVAISDVAAQDGYIGAQINTLNSLSQVMSTQQENVVSAQNAVQATDYASATSNMSKYEILSQTGIAALAQANQVQQEVTKLLQ